MGLVNVLMVVVAVVAAAAVVGALVAVAVYCYKRRQRLSHTTLFDDSASLGSHDDSSRLASSLKTPLLRFQSVP